MFEQVVQDIYGVFAGSGWVDTGYKAFPSNYQGTIDTKPYVLVSVLANNKKTVNFERERSLQGLMILSIFTDTTKGDKELFHVADVLNDLFEEKILSNGTQFELGNLSKGEVDPDNKSLYRADYSIRFTLFGD